MRAVTIPGSCWMGVTLQRSLARHVGPISRPTLHSDRVWLHGQTAVWSEIWPDSGMGILHCGCTSTVPSPVWLSNPAKFFGMGLCLIHNTFWSLGPKMLLHCLHPRVHCPADTHNSVDDFFPSRKGTHKQNASNAKFKHSTSELSTPFSTHQ